MEAREGGGAGSGARILMISYPHCSQGTAETNNWIGTACRVAAYCMPTEQ